jgi:hypothetical protein
MTLLLMTLACGEEELPTSEDTGSVQGDDTGEEPIDDTGERQDDTGEEPGCECPEGFSLNAAEDGCERAILELASATHSVCEGIDNSVYGRYGARYPEGTVDDGSEWTQRLNEQGVWACDGVSSSEEWIGFQVCVDNAEPADFMVGMAADNYYQVLVDGELVIDASTYDGKWFYYWWVYAIEIEEGQHTVELRAANSGAGMSTFGADLSGPFEQGSLSDDLEMIKADYEGQLQFSAIDRLDGAFTADKALSCPEGLELDACEGTCSGVEEAACL